MKRRLLVVLLSFVAVAGAGLVVEGVRRIYPPAALILLGVLLALWAAAVASQLEDGKGGAA